MKSQIVTFVVDKKLDISSHLIALNSYKQNLGKNLGQARESNLENLSKLTLPEDIQSEIEKIIDPYYKKEEKLLSLARDINEEWVKIEEGFILKLEEIHKFPFPYKAVKRVLSSASRFGYKLDEGWFATSMMRNKFQCIDTATHELMHFMFHKYYDQVCRDRGLSQGQMWDVKESFSVLLNIECSDLRFQKDNGYPPHVKLREIIRESWLKNHDFTDALEEAIVFVKRNSDTLQ